MILPAGAQQSRLKEKQKFLMAVPIDDPTPAFPDEVTSDVDATLCVELVVHEDGSVGDVKQIDTAPSCEPLQSEASRQFLPAVLSAVESWTYFAAALCEYQTSEAECDAADARLTPVSIRLAYRFAFRQEGSRRNTSTAAWR
jgi:hypothetical protein